MSKSVSLVLGSGGAHGMAHTGVIKWLRDNKYQIKTISGCSIGSLIGGVAAAGKLLELGYLKAAKTIHKEKQS